jgi:hypothetical protein
LLYTYRCPEHGEFDIKDRGDYAICGYFYLGKTPPVCGREAKRVWSFIVDSSFEPYYAPSFGQVVKSRTHAKDLAKIASEEQTLRTGIEHNYKVVETHDDAAVGINTDEKKAELDNTRRFAVNGAAWSAERRKEIKEARAKVKAERLAKQAVDA